MPIDLFANASLNVTDWLALSPNSSNSSNSTLTWLSRYEVEHFLGDPGVLHAIGLVFGLVAILFSKRLPVLLAVVASLTLGLWVGLLVQERQTFEEPLIGDLETPDGIWLPITLGVLAAIAAAALAKFAWRAALALLTSGVLMLLALAICRLLNTTPEDMFKMGAALLSTYRVIGVVVLVVTILLSALAVRKFHKVMVGFTSAHLGVLLLLSGLSHFAQRLGAVERPFSLLDDLARIAAEVRGGRCKLWEEGSEPATERNADGHAKVVSSSAVDFESCDCGDQCRTEILAWILGSLTVVLFRWYWDRRTGKGDAKEKESLTQASEPTTDSKKAGGFSRVPVSVVGNSSRC